MEIIRRRFENIQKGIKSDMKKILDERAVGDNDFQTDAIISDIEESNNKMLSVMNTATTINGDEEVLPKDK